MKKEKQKYIISTTMDYADEFDYPVISVFSAKTKNKILDNTNLIPDDEEYYFGTNEYLELSAKEIIKLISSAKPISNDEIKILDKYEVFSMGLDIVASVSERIENPEDYE